MNQSTQALELFDEFIEDLMTGATPRVYARMAAALGIEVEELEELLALFAWAHYLEHWARLHRRRNDEEAKEPE
ncbi:MAG: hypothetical protein NZP34_04730, partial [Caldilineales bacterium]|nr:hypothetical protein [Caldilineales bacterium]